MTVQKDRNRIFIDTLNRWLQTNNKNLKKSIDKTVKEGFFSFEDIKHQIRALKRTITKSNIDVWTQQVNSKDQHLDQKSVLGFHAGNIPLVGFHDMMAVVLTGANYVGKISKKDPYLLPSFLQLLKESDIPGNISWSSDLDSLSGLNCNAALFAGNQESAEIVKDKAVNINALEKEAPFLERSAHYSIALIDDFSPKTMTDLTEAVFRYGGQGCRSVAVVFAPAHLDSEKCMFTDYIESFWLKNKQHKTPEKSLFHRFAYNKAIGISQAWLDDFLIEETEMKPDTPYVLHWIKGDYRDLISFIKRYKDGLQSVYTQDGSPIHGLNIKTEKIELSQVPPVQWKPDGIDSIEWLFKKLN